MRNLSKVVFVICNFNSPVGHVCFRLAAMAVKENLGTFAFRLWEGQEEQGLEAQDFEDK